jgi:hypothetical protein
VKELTSHCISDDHPYNCGVIGWAVFDGKKFISHGGYRYVAEEKALRLFPDATFREGPGMRVGRLNEIIEEQREKTGE